MKMIFILKNNGLQISEGKAFKNENLILKINIIMETKMSNYRNCFALAYVLLAVVLSSCGNSDKNFPTTPSKFVVTRIEPNTKTTSIYLVEPTEKQDLNMSHTWVVDSVGKFNAGDTLSFQHYR